MKKDHKVPALKKIGELFKIGDDLIGTLNLGIFGEMTLIISPNRFRKDDNKKPHFIIWIKRNEMPLKRIWGKENK